MKYSRPNIRAMWGYDCMAVIISSIQGAREDGHVEEIWITDEEWVPSG